MYYRVCIFILSYLSIYSASINAMRYSDYQSLIKNIAEATEGTGTFFIHFDNKSAQDKRIKIAILCGCAVTGKRADYVFSAIIIPAHARESIQLIKPKFTGQADDISPDVLIGSTKILIYYDGIEQDIFHINTSCDLETKLVSIPDLSHQIG